MINHGKSKLSHEILKFIFISAVISLILFFMVSTLATGIVEEYCFNREIEMTEFDWMRVDRIIFGGSAFLFCVSFSILFLILMNDQMIYIQKITQGIDALRAGAQEHVIPLEGKNELTELAAAINDMSVAQRQIRMKEQALTHEKEQLIRTLSHDIRTPLTSILAYSDYMIAQEQITPQEQKEYMKLIQKKGQQMKELTTILLDGTRRNVERFEDAKLLLEQIVAEFEEELEDDFQVVCDLADCLAFAGSFDVQELRRIFDNLASNIKKYANPEKDITLEIKLEKERLWIRQKNAVISPKNKSDSYQIGLNSIRRIAQLYDGQVSVKQDKEYFEILITLEKFL